MTRDKAYLYGVLHNVRLRIRLLMAAQAPIMFSDRWQDMLFHPDTPLPDSGLPNFMAAQAPPLQWLSLWCRWSDCIHAYVERCPSNRTSAQSVQRSFLNCRTKQNLVAAAPAPPLGTDFGFGRTPKPAAALAANAKQTSYIQGSGSCYTYGGAGAAATVVAFMAPLK